MNLFDQLANYLLEEKIKFEINNRDMVIYREKVKGEVIETYKSIILKEEESDFVSIESLPVNRVAIPFNFFKDKDGWRLIEKRIDKNKHNEIKAENCKERFIKLVNCLNKYGFFNKENF